MFGLISTLTNLVALIYPLYGSYNSIMMYLNLREQLFSGGEKSYQRPIQELIKLGLQSTEEVSKENYSLNCTIESLNKWLIYWMTYLSLSVMEKILFLPHIVPFYSLMKLPFHVWLVLPLIGKTGMATTRGSETIQFNKSFEEFKNSGCGFIFFSFLKPIAEGESKLFGSIEIGNIDFSQVFSSSGVKFGSKSPSKESDANKLDAESYLNKLMPIYSAVSYVSSYLNSVLRNDASKSPNDKSNISRDLDDYDFVDKPTPAESGFTASSAASEGIDKRRRWFGSETTPR